MNWQELLTSDTALIIYGMIILIVGIFFILRLRKQIKELRENQEQEYYLNQRKNLDSRLSNDRGGN